MRSVRLALFAVFGAATVAASGIVANAAGAALSPDLVHISPGVKHVGEASAAPLSTAQCEAQYKIACYGAAQIQRAYDLPALYADGTEGAGQTIAIVDSFGSPTVQQDLATFDHAYGLPTPKLSVIQPAGAVPPWDPNNSDMVGWAGETTLDVEWAHTIAPRANILLVETPVSETEGTTGFPEIVTAEKYVIDHHLASVISQSFSASEPSFPSVQSLMELRGAYLDAYQHHITVLTASGDDGAADVGSDGTNLALTPTTSWPDSDPLITGVGGTQLHLSAGGRHTAPDNVWNDTYDKNTQEYIYGNDGPNPLAGGGGESQVFNRPAYQDGVIGTVGEHRGVPDISMSGACNGAVNVYQSFSGQPAGWYPTCGTSEATPLFSGIVALTAQAAGHPVGLINPALYLMSAAHSPGIVDVTSGDNTVSFTQGGAQHTVTGYDAGLGYDLASGVGTVDAAWFVPQLAEMSH
ncbi:MAG TPA: S53 family peptidase [Pseudonocardiaceae bacterium]|jgi:subtilase family serine protease|nr:S53 family peptidase [Pseudonocardiaceae bacterium]